MKNKAFKKIIFGLMIISAIGIFLTMISAENEETCGDFSIKLVKSMGLDKKLKPGAVVDDYINLLKEQGVVFPSDFDPAKPITKEIKANLLAQALNVEEGKETIQTRAEIYRNKAIIKEIVGNVMVKLKDTDEWIPAKLDMELGEEDYIKTGPGSSVFLQVGVAGRVEIRENSELLLKTLSTQADKKAENILIYLAMGEISVDVRFIDKETTFETHTPTTVAAVRGTIYVVIVRPVDGKTEIREKR